VTPAERRAAVARTLGPLPADVANVNVVQDARYRLVTAHLSGVRSEIDRYTAYEAGWIADTREQRARLEKARREAARG
jgi:hypothetical protein